MPRRPVVAIGDRFGKLVVIGDAPRRGGRLAYRVKCDCGNEHQVLGRSLRDGSSRSCGCIRRTAHGHAAGGRSPTYGSWFGMHCRCRYSYTRSFEHYGGRGISVCARWTGPGGFANFLADMGERPPGTSLDRLDPDGDYEPGNCRWATASEQRANLREC